MASPPLVMYYHRQMAPLCLLLYGLAAMFFAVGWTFRHEPALSIITPIAGLILLVLAASFHHLTVADEGEVLAIRFGPLPLFRTLVRYSDVRRVEVGRTTITDGWGIQLNPRRGWVWNLWGRDCVVFHLRNGAVFRLGTDDAENLARFVQTRLEDFREQPG